MPQANPTDNRVLSYKILRRAIGFLGFLLPIGLMIYSTARMKHFLLLPSISHYYYSHMHIFFVGSLCLLGSFLICYRGKEKNENHIATLAGIAALLVSTFPTDFDSYEHFGSCLYLSVYTSKPWFSNVHLGSATVMFLCFIYFCFCIFPKKDNVNAPANDPKKKIRNIIYRVCGIVISLSILSIALLYCIKSLRELISPFFSSYIFFFETTALFAFGTSWLVKGTYELDGSKNKVVRRLVKFIR